MWTTFCQKNKNKCELRVVFMRRHWCLFTSIVSVGGVHTQLQTMEICNIFLTYKKWHQLSNKVYYILHAWQNKNKQKTRIIAIVLSTETEIFLKDPSFYLDLHERAWLSDDVQVVQNLKHNKKRKKKSDRLSRRPRFTYTPILFFCWKCEELT